MEYINVCDISIPAQLDKCLAWTLCIIICTLCRTNHIYDTSFTLVSSFISGLAFVPSLLENLLKRVRRAIIWDNFICIRHRSKFTTYIIASILTTQRNGNYYDCFREVGVQRD